MIYKYGGQDRVVVKVFAFTIYTMLDEKYMGSNPAATRNEKTHIGQTPA